MVRHAHLRRPADLLGDAALRLRAILLQGVAPAQVSISQIYKGIVPFVLLQLIGLVLMIFFPGIITGLPSIDFGG